MTQGARDKSCSVKMFVLGIQLKLKKKKGKQNPRRIMCMYLLIFACLVVHCICVLEELIHKPEGFLLP